MDLTCMCCVFKQGWVVFLSFDMFQTPPNTPLKPTKSTTPPGAPIRPSMISQPRGRDVERTPSPTPIKRGKYDTNEHQNAPQRPATVAYPRPVN